MPLCGVDYGAMGRRGRRAAGGIRLRPTAARQSSRCHRWVCGVPLDGCARVPAASGAEGALPVGRDAADSGRRGAAEAAELVRRRPGKPVAV